MSRIAGATVTGTSHLRHGLPNQDAIAWLPQAGEGERVVMAVSDGHGNALCPRSQVGSRFAVDAATRVLWSHDVPTTGEALRDAVRRIVAAWDDQVRSHLERNPLTTEELDAAAATGADAARRLTSRPSLAYGATLLFALVDAERVVVGQLGDGDVVLVDAGGQAYRPLPRDERLMAHVTTSLCGDDPVGDTRTAVLPLGASLVLLATDGYANSFADDAAFLQVGRDLLAELADHGMTGVRRRLPQWLTETSSQGAGDDISVAIALTPVAPFGAKGLDLAGQEDVAGAAPDLLAGRRPRARPPVVPLQGPEAAAGATAPWPGLDGHGPPVDQPVAAQPVAIPIAYSSVSASVPSRPQAVRQPWRPLLTAGAVVVAAVVVAAALLIVRRPATQPASGAHRVTAPLAGSSSQLAPAPSVNWSHDDAGELIERHNGPVVTSLRLASPYRDFLPVPAGALLLLSDGRVGLLPATGDLRVGAWPTCDATRIALVDGRYYLLDGYGHPRCTVDAGTGAVSSNATGKDGASPATTQAPPTQQQAPQPQPQPQPPSTDTGPGAPYSA